MFQFPGFPSAYADTRCSQRVGFPIRTSLSQRLSPARQGFSQVIASFFGSSARASTVDPSYLDHSSDSVRSLLQAVPVHSSFRVTSCHAPRQTMHPFECRARLPSERLRKDTGQTGGCQEGGGCNAGAKSPYRCAAHTDYAPCRNSWNGTGCSCMQQNPYFSLLALVRLIP